MMELTLNGWQELHCSEFDPMAVYGWAPRSWHCQVTNEIHTGMEKFPVFGSWEDCEADLQCKDPSSKQIDALFFQILVEDLDQCGLHRCRSRENIGTWIVCHKASPANVTLPACCFSMQDTSQ